MINRMLHAVELMLRDRGVDPRDLETIMPQVEFERVWVAFAMHGETG